MLASPLILIYGHKKGSQHEDPDLGPHNSKITGRELTLAEEISIRLDTPVESLHDKGILNKREYDSGVAMGLHESSKATAFEALDEEL